MFVVIGYAAIKILIQHLVSHLVLIIACEMREYRNSDKTGYYYIIIDNTYVLNMNTVLFYNLYNHNLIDSLQQC